MGELISSRLKNYSKKQVLSAAKNKEHGDFDEERYILEALTEKTNVSIAYLDPKLNIIYVNSNYVKESGFTKKQLIGQNHFKLFPNKENEKIFRRVVKSGRPVRSYRKPFTYPNQPGRDVTYWDWTLSPVKGSLGKVEGLVLSSVEVTDDVRSDTERERLLSELKKEQLHTRQLMMEAEKRASEMDAIFMAMADPLIVYNKAGEVVGVNPATLLTLGFDPVGKSRKQVVKKLLVRHIDGRMLPEEEMLSTQALAGKTVASKPYLFKTNEGEDVAALVSSSPIFNGKRVAGAVVIMHDISDRLKLEQQKDEFIAIASHELKTPITTLKAFVQILQKQLAEDPNRENLTFLKKMDDQLERLAALVKELLDVSRIESGIIPLHNGHFDFDQMVMGVIGDLQRISHRHHLIIRGSTGKKIWGDKNRLTQVITNLILNASKYSPTADKIIIHLLSNRHNVIVKVRDFGIGIAKEDQAKIFNRFFRVKGASGERFPGLGLGLYISTEIIRSHGGKIWVKSTPGKGSTFFFSLPIKMQKR